MFVYFFESLQKMGSRFPVFFWGDHHSRVWDFVFFDLRFNSSTQKESCKEACPPITIFSCISLGCLKGRNIFPNIHRFGTRWFPGLRISHFRMFGILGVGSALFGMPRKFQTISTLSDKQQMAPINVWKFRSNSCNKHLESSVAYYRLQIVIKGKLENFPQRLRDSDAFQRLAICKGTVPNGPHRIRDSDAEQRLATEKGTFPNGCHRIRDSDALQGTAICKSKVRNGRHWLRNSDAGQRTAIFKCTFPNDRHRLRDCNARQRNASCKGISPNGRHWHLRHHTDACQRPAICEGTLPNGRHRLGDCHLDHLIAVLKGSSRNFCDRLWDVNLKEALCMDCICCCGFNFISGVNHSHFRFWMQQPRRLQCLIIIYQQSVGQDLYFDNFALNGIFTMLLFIKHILVGGFNPFEKY